ncbi:alkaline phosphatase D family protein [Corynebacterium pyruviciproducens]|uniref:alkaline phosphatase D family protein n=1 Tax=Corynebacterium pyruviciproducens TaxID=598660 RepID=UPI00288B4F96|nr:alkaline phosphatase D family protein [Corynebacterium pyruviciproducens]
MTTTVAATMGVARAQYSERDDPGGVFQHGVASGDPTPTSVIIWTRVTVPGEPSEPIPVAWEVAIDENFTRLARTGIAYASPVHDYTVHVDVTGLTPGTTYFYRFSLPEGGAPAAPDISRTGRTITAPLDPQELRLAVTSCANMESGYFGAYSEIARKAENGEIDVALHLGDYFYEYASGRYVGKHGITRPTAPEWECVTLEDYRARYAHYRRDAELQWAHAALPWIVTWDDHECANDSWAASVDMDRRAGAMQAYLEWMPIRATTPSTGGHIYRSLAFGELAEVSMLDLRTYRSAPTRFKSQDPTRQMLGSEQFEWLSGRLSTSDARWKIIGNSVMMAPLNILGTPLTEYLGHGMGSLPLNPDQWDGYQAERTRLLELVARTPGCVFLTGDIHSEWATELRVEGRTVAPEFVCTSVSAPNVDDKLHLPAGNPTSRALAAYVRQVNPHVHHVELDSHGFMLVTLTSELVDARWFRVDDVETKGSPIRLAHEESWDGEQLV